MLFDRVRRARRGPAAALERGARLLDRGDPAGAAEAFRVAAQSGDPAVAPPASLRLGLTLRRLGDRAGAEAALRSAAGSGHPDHGPMAAFHLGGLYEDDAERAAAAYRRAVDSRHAEAAPRAALRLAAIREEQGDLDTAEFLYSRALDSRHADVAPRAALGLGDLRRRRGELESAAAAFRKAADSRHPDVTGPALEALDALTGAAAEQSAASELTIRFPDRATGDRVAADRRLLDAFLVEHGRADLLGGRHTGRPSPRGGYEIVVHGPAPGGEGTPPAGWVGGRIDRIAHMNHAVGAPALTPEREKDAAALARLGPTTPATDRAAARALGLRLNGEGGVPLMLAVLCRAEMLSLQQRAVTILRTVDAVWDGIGDGRG
jgi:tetratricopeptide (TPR) repeat protein